MFGLMLILSVSLYACNNNGEGENADNDTTIIIEETDNVGANGMEGTNNNMGADADADGTMLNQGDINNVSGQDGMTETEKKDLVEYLKSI